MRPTSVMNPAFKEAKETQTCKPHSISSGNPLGKKLKFLDIAWTSEHCMELPVTPSFEVRD